MHAQTNTSPNIHTNTESTARARRPVISFSLFAELPKSTAQLCHFQRVRLHVIPPTSLPPALPIAQRRHNANEEAQPPVMHAMKSCGTQPHTNTHTLIWLGVTFVLNIMPGASYYVNQHTVKPALNDTHLQLACEPFMTDKKTSKHRFHCKLYCIILLLLEMCLIRHKWCYWTSHLRSKHKPNRTSSVAKMMEWGAVQAISTPRYYHSHCQRLVNVN